MSPELINIFIAIAGLALLYVIEKRRPTQVTPAQEPKPVKKAVRLTPEQIEAVKMKRRIKQLERKAKSGDITAFEKQELYNLYARTS